ncbi:hypothetical protein PQX77_020306 [Marasmius sp. AFHP31]|nr:hypothetical protein PQX77_020306 [Marasmius sp. AFHP31]
MAAQESGIGLPEANFLALVLESLLYGSFCVLFAAALWAILTKRRLVNLKLLSTLIAMWTLSTIHLILDLIRAKAAFIDARDAPDGAPGSLAYYLDLSNPLEPAKTAVNGSYKQSSSKIYRCYIVWGRWYMCFIPAILLCGTGVVGYGATYSFTRAAPGAEVFLPAIVPWVTSFFVLTFSTNIICTVLIVIRILSIQKAVSGSSGASGRFVSSRMNFSLKAVVIVTESAAVYSATVLSLLVLYTLGSNGQYIVLDMTSPIIGIVFTFIILRATLLSGSEQAYSSAPIPNTSRVATGAGSENYGMQPRMTTVSVNVTQFTERDSFDNKPSSDSMV